MHIDNNYNIYSALKVLLIVFGTAASSGYSENLYSIEKFTGFWKENCNEAYGLQIKPYKDGLYNINFCGPGGSCNEPPNSARAINIENNPEYEVINSSTIRIIYSEGYTPIYKKCTENTKPVLKYSNESTKKQDSPFITCSGSPKEAKLLLPESDVREWAKVVCSKYGHLIVPSDGYLWSYYGGFVPIVLSAQQSEPSKKPKEVGNAVYFTDISVVNLELEEAKEVALKARFSNSETIEEIPSVYKLSAKSSTNAKYIVYFMAYKTKLMRAMPYPKWFTNPGNDKLLPFFIYYENK